MIKWHALQLWENLGRNGLSLLGQLNPNYRQKYRNTNDKYGLNLKKHHIKLYHVYKISHVWDQ